MERSLRIPTTAWESKNLVSSIKKSSYFNVSAIMFCKQFLAYTVHVDGPAFSYTIHKHLCISQHTICVNYMHIYKRKNIHSRMCICN